MTKLRAWGVAALLAVVVIIAGGWFLALSPQNSKVSTLHDQTAQQQDANAKLTSQIALLKKQQSQIPAEQARIAQIKGRIPDTPQMTTYIRTLTSLAAATHVELVSIAPAQPTLVKLPSAQPQSAPASGAATGKGGAATGKGGAATGTGGTAAAPASLSTISVAIDVVGDYYSVQQFLSKLEDTQRVTIVSAVSLKPGTLPHGTGGGAATTSSSTSSDGQWKTLDAGISASIFMSAAPTTSTASVAGQAQPSAAAATPAAPPASPAPNASASN